VEEKAMLRRMLLVGTTSMVLVGLSVWAAGLDSGLKVGEHVPAYNPKHVAGPDKGTTACPV